MTAGAGLRVLYVLRYYPTLTETFIYREASALLARGVQVELAGWGPRADGALQDQLPPWIVHEAPRGKEGVRLVFGLRHLASSTVRRALRHVSRPKDQARALWLADLARGYDRVHAHFAGEAAEVALAAATLAGRPFSVTCHAADLFVPRPSLGDVLRSAQPAIAVCEDGRRAIAKHGVDAKLVRMGVPVDVPAAAPASPGPLRVVTVARDVPKKGLSALRTACQALDVSLDVVTDVPPSQVPERLARAHAFALPCRVAPNGDRDGIPVAILEAMAAGLPVIAGAAGGVPEVVDGTVGWLVSGDDEGALVSSVSHALRAAEDPAARKQRGEAGRARVLANHTLTHQVDALLEAWS